MSAAKVNTPKQATLKELQTPTSSSKPSTPALAQKTPPKTPASGSKMTTPVSRSSGGEAEAAILKAEGSTPAPFVASPTFKGQRDGYVFKRDSKGVGYYSDTKQQKKAEKENKRSSGSKGKGSNDAQADKKGVRFGENKELDYTRSVQALKTTKSPEQARAGKSPKGVLKKHRK